MYSNKLKSYCKQSQEETFYWQVLSTAEKMHIKGTIFCIFSLKSHNYFSFTNYFNITD